jgi:hypothetical protein
MSVAVLVPSAWPRSGNNYEVWVDNKCVLATDSLEEAKEHARKSSQALGPEDGPTRPPRPVFDWYLAILVAAYALIGLKLYLFWSIFQ